ncbi:MAG: tail fiber domain-containing protein [Chitinophagaceae bacterium]|nr:tail fiber domain-containing protein [Chitinophagaceae bacterium]
MVLNKKLSILFALFIFCVQYLQGQVPQAFPYQAIARDSSGTQLINQNISLRFSVLDGNQAGPVVYQETHSVLTNNLGLMNVNIGQGIVQSGVFNSINWGSGFKYLQVEMDINGGNNFIVMGTSQLLSVPYALYAENASVPGPQGPQGIPGPPGLNGSANLSGTTNHLIKFTDSITGGNSVIYEDGLGQIGIGTTSPAAKLDVISNSGTVANFDGATGMYISLHEGGVYRGYLGSYAGSNEDIDFGTGNSNTNGNLHLTIKAIPKLTINTLGNVGIGTTTPSSRLDVNGQIRIQGGAPGDGKVLMSNASGVGSWTTLTADDANAWGKTGNAGTDPANNYIGTSDNESLKMKVNNTQVGFFKTDGNIYMGLNSGVSAISASRNVGIGVATLYTNSTGDYQVAIGDSALFKNTFGTQNIGIGYKAMYGNTAGTYNTAMGYKALSENTIGVGNTAVGYQAILNNTNGDYNVGLGYKSLEQNTTGNKNIAIGFNALQSNTAGSSNIAMGQAAIYSNLSSSKLIGIGDSSLYLNTTGSNNLAIGHNTLQENTTGSSNTAMGAQSLHSNFTGNYNSAYGFLSMEANTTGNENSALGYMALRSNNYGSYNLALGSRSLFSNTSGSSNVAVGYKCLMQNTYGNNNVAMGSMGLHSLYFGDDNVAVGKWTLYGNLYGSFNTAIGSEALYNNQADLNTALGAKALSTNVYGSENTGIGYMSLSSNSQGDYNTASGTYSMNSNNTGNENSGVGYRALENNTNGSGNTAIGFDAGSYRPSNDYCTFLGYDADISVVSTATNSTAIGNGARMTASNQVKLGNTSVISIGGYEPWSNLSDGRFKKDITEGVKGLEFITKLRPVTYRLDVRKLNQFLNPVDTAWRDEEAISKKEAILRSGFIAQEVEAAAQKTGYDFNGVDKPQNEHDHYSLRYSEFVVPLVKGMQEQQVMIEKLQQTNESLMQRLQEMEKKMDAMVK